MEKGFYKTIYFHPISKSKTKKSKKKTFLYIFCNLNI
jgi:hypothetical protein